MKGYKTDIEKVTLENTNFRKVLYTSQHLQLVVMTLNAGEEIGEEIHKNDQFFRFESGNGKVEIDGNEYDVTEGDIIIVPAGAKHNVKSVGNYALKMYTLYAPPHHKDGVVHATKREAEVDKEEFDMVTTE